MDVTLGALWTLAAKGYENAQELEDELNLHLLERDQTGGWVDTHFDIVDQLSPTENRAARRDHTDKLDLELDTAVSLFNWLPQANWPRNLAREDLGSSRAARTRGSKPRAEARPGARLHPHLDTVRGGGYPVAQI